MLRTSTSVSSAQNCPNSERRYPMRLYTVSYGWRISMRIPNAVDESRPWRIQKIAPDFTVEDVWALPVYGGAGDFQTLLEVMASLDPAQGASLATRLLFAV